MATVDLTKDNFEQVVGGNDMVMVDFWAPWCAPCRAFAPTFEQASEQHADVVFAKVNTEEEQEVAAPFNIRSIPTLMVFRENVILYAEAGSLPAKKERGNPPRTQSFCRASGGRRSSEKPPSST